METHITQVGILSDSHDNMDALKSAVTVFNEKNVDLVIHAGDLVSPFTAREINRLSCPVVIVYGNNDGEILGLNKTFQGNIFQPPHTIKVNEKKVLIMHDPILLGELEKKNGFDVIIYGHLHEVDIRTGKPVIINPGECGGWLTGRKTVAIWHVDTDDVELIDL